MERDTYYGHKPGQDPGHEYHNICEGEIYYFKEGWICSNYSTCGYAGDWPAPPQDAGK